MKIYGPNQSQFNPYHRQIHKQTEPEKGSEQKDHIEISNKAKQLQEHEQVDSKRAAYVEEIKQAVESGDYQMNAAKTVEKMLAFWSTRS
ncbi:flagellar biosynthesis anti-sigma factor FlgM [Lentibacillus saliphilus]|uniref:flagellar biosynthesis anti-sigma factor FlgM n=1 Tax=Lentibacillus saliphilus TaxID=2737028 RepID=UPI001C30079E|nr:flagellar biosynthesis anti-sigma factor FlgM [Lentibacillus saliphilus]